MTAPHPCAGVEQPPGARARRSLRSRHRRGSGSSSRIDDAGGNLRHLFVRVRPSVPGIRDQLVDGQICTARSRKRGDAAPMPATARFVVRDFAVMPGPSLRSVVRIGSVVLDAPRVVCFGFQHLVCRTPRDSATAANVSPVAARTGSRGQIHDPANNHIA